MKKSLLSVRNLTIRAENAVLVRGMNVDLYEQDLLGIAGESGSGKTMFVRAVLGILPPGVSCSADSIRLFDQELTRMPEKQRRKLIGEQVGFIPQNTIAYLHPMLKIRRQILDSYLQFGKGTKAEALQKASELLGTVGFNDPERILNSFVWELSGGMRQRVNIVMALMNDPRILIADEPTTALDAAVARQILENLRAFNREKGITMIMISHDLRMLSQYSTRSLVMYAGRMVEVGDTHQLFENPMHPYTRALMNVVPDLDLDRSIRLTEIPGFVPDSGRDSDSCIFYDRCHCSAARCKEKIDLQDLGNGHFCLCTLAQSGEVPNA